MIMVMIMYAITQTGLQKVYCITYCTDFTNGFFVFELS
jgi:hypothetical protein